MKLQKYNQAKFEIMKMIANMNLHVGDRLPGEREITADSKFSVITLRRAMKDLEKQGIIKRLPRMGTFLNKPIEKNDLDEILFIHSFKEENNGYAFPPTIFYDLNEGLSNHFLSIRFHAACTPDASIVDTARDCVAILIQGWISKEWVDFLKALGRPALVVGSNPFPLELPTVSFDWKTAAKGVSSHFLKHGFKRIGLINGVEGYFPAEQIYAGYDEAMSEAGVAIDERLVIWPCQPQLHKLISGYLDANTDCDALIIESGAILAFLQCAWNRKLDAKLTLGMIGDNPDTKDFYEHIDEAVIALFESPICDVAARKILSTLANDPTETLSEFIRPTIQAKTKGTWNEKAKNEDR